jgi:nitrite reductase (cytochrome c-552)
MNNTTVHARGSFGRKLIYLAIVVVTAGLTFGLAALLMNINARKQEAKETFVRVAALDENTIDPKTWGQDFPREYDGYLKTADNERAQFGGSEALPPEKLELDPRLRRIYAGYAFSVSYREKRGHAFMLTDQEVTPRQKAAKQPGACLHCHASILPEYRFLGNGDVHAGFVKSCAMGYQESHDLKDDKGQKLIAHPVSCIDCHSPDTLQLRVTRPGFLDGIQNLALSNDPLPQYASIVKWRQDGRKGTYDPNKLASRQEMRSFVCGQCHVEYYFKGDGKLLTYPWHNGLKVEEIEKYYDDQQFKDWTHAETGAPMLKAQHPEFELWNQGIHARSGVACADCHMPYKREGALKISDHQVRSPILNSARACQVCHHYPEAEIMARSDAIQKRTKSVQDRAEDALLQLMDSIKAANDRGIADDKLNRARQLHRSAQWRVDFISSENSRGFHAPAEAVRILAEAIDFARQGQLEAVQSQKP